MNAAAVFNTPPRTSVLNSVTRKPYDAKQQVSVSRPVESKQVHSSKQINSDSVSQPTYKQSDAGIPDHVKYADTENMKELLTSGLLR
mmetsp:Transcript_11907/g.22658  ORF Transcript_11907/g.22658 Transcript_11907/m.22658 type:complete len:87 (+) Transcript_11907:92-352(+)|eukprot:CAMPEP_0114231198 /NCGR_PEP_ID=MMETSP0058-20121206/3902_1 /TAXON_ID=36894 /ORGANISM="Pyramimonas parkeae, CCMP726" /LENGTH=86 /DNA_ID=CAMNT_0001342503 /DNA_START=92 /DNA_END=352 /DNA_ORIENTATION=-